MHSVVNIALLRYVAPRPYKPTATSVPQCSSLCSNNDRWDDRSATINEREARINARIQRGLRDGRITNREARRLYNELADIEEKERAFGSDGRLSGRESAELNRDLDRLAEDVREQMRDEQRRY
jgi:hypothetical protein